MKKAPAYASEAELCAAFIAAIGPEWTSYAETGGWDILLVRGVDGFQIGIQAKLRFGAHVISQALEERGHYRIENAGPDCRAVLVPSGEAQHFGAIADYIGITVITLRGASFGRPAVDIWPPLPAFDRRYYDDHWHEWCPSKRHPLPEYVPDVAAGMPCPLQLTDWKVAAIKIAVTLELRGSVSRLDFKTHRIDHRRWIAAEMGWLTVRDGRWIAGPRIPDFRLQHPRVYEEIKADAEKWLPAVVATPATQPDLLLREAAE